MKRVLPMIEVAMVLGVFLFLRAALRDSDLAGWQRSVFGAAPVSSTLLFFILPLVVILATRRDPGSSGLTTRRLRYHLRVATRALAVVAPATILFPVVLLLGSEPTLWLGASLLGVGFAAAGYLMTRWIRGLTTRSETALDPAGLMIYVGVLAAGMAVMAPLHLVSPLLTRIVLVLVFVGFLEEHFFRGYVQTRLNESLGRPWSFRGVEFGAGLVLAAAVFGLMHPLTALADATPWPWALWTAAFGLALGFLREKTGSVLTPAVVHGVMLVPGVLFGSVGQ